MRFSRLCGLAVVLGAPCLNCVCGKDDEPYYGVDHSWPTQRPARQQGSSLLSRSQLESYLRYMEGCGEAYSHKLCGSNDADRIAINAAQPALQRNFTSAGYAKVSAPSKSFAVLEEFWNSYHEDYLEREEWAKGNVHTNH